MAREIKFRAYSKVDKLMFVNIHESITFPDKSQYTFDDFLKNTGYHEWEIMQFTGLRLNDGTEVFEGDIYEYRYEYDSDYDGDMPIVKESSGRKVVKDIFDTWQIKEALSEGWTVKVIGNIHQHKHLLE